MRDDQPCLPASGVEVMLERRIELALGRRPVEMKTPLLRASARLSFFPVRDGAQQHHGNFFFSLSLLHEETARTFCMATALIPGRFSFSFSFPCPATTRHAFPFPC